MTVGAIILAAGSDHIAKEFKPLLKVGNQTLIQREVSSLREAGISPIVVVTGYMKEDLEKHLV
ncbi:MAG: NTP transferase domain-containing protein, partial [Anaerovoracaceae bacterium]